MKFRTKKESKFALQLVINESDTHRPWFIDLSKVTYKRKTNNAIK
jgi:hypothetical protein